MNPVDSKALDEMDAMVEEAIAAGDVQLLKQICSEALKVLITNLDPRIQRRAQDAMVKARIAYKDLEAKRGLAT